MDVHRGSALAKITKVVRPRDGSLQGGSLRAQTSAISVALTAAGAVKVQRADLLLSTTASSPGQGAPPCCSHSSKLC